MKTHAKNTICLWYDRDAEEAARFYAQPFPIHPLAQYSWHRGTTRPESRGMC